VPSDWAAAYAELIGRLPRFVSGARLSLCGFSACVDAVVDLATAEALLRAEGATPAAALATELKRPDFVRQVAAPSGAFLADAIVQVSGLDALRAALQNGPRAFFRAYEKTLQADKSLIPLTHAIVERLK